MQLGHSKIVEQKPITSSHFPHKYQIVTSFQYNLASFTYWCSSSMKIAAYQHATNLSVRGRHPGFI